MGCRDLFFHRAIFTIVCSASEASLSAFHASLAAFNASLSVMTSSVYFATAGLSLLWPVRHHVTAE